jgi:ACR3 family arsenite efflux pump ArsB
MKNKKDKYYYEKKATLLILIGFILTIVLVLLIALIKILIGQEWANVLFFIPLLTYAFFLAWAGLTLIEKAWLDMSKFFMEQVEE